jgi:hypothetical protein
MAKCGEAIGEAFNWVEHIAYREEDGVLQIRILHTYPDGVDIRRSVRAYLRQWIPRVIPIELFVNSVFLSELEWKGIEHV